MTSADGSWSVNDSLFLIGNNYTARIMFLDALKLPINNTMIIHVTANNQTIVFPETSYPDFVSASVTGVALNGNQT
jgi:hypothetical protein